MKNRNLKYFNNIKNELDSKKIEIDDISEGDLEVILDLYNKENIEIENRIMEKKNEIIAMMNQLKAMK